MKCSSVSTREKAEAAMGRFVFSSGIFRLALSFGSAWLVACAGTPHVTERMVDRPVGMSHQFGTPTNRSYSADVETEKDVLRLMIYEQSECERIRVKVVSRTRETLHDDRVVQRDPIGPTQIADGSDGMVPCAQRYARDARVSLRVGSATHFLGRTDGFGELAVNLSAELEQSLYGDQAPEQATLVVERQDVRDVSLAQLDQHERRKDQLLAEFEAILSKPEMSEADIARSYVLYEQLGKLGQHDGRISGLQARFLELLYGRQAEADAKQLKRNLQALKEAKELLASGVPGVPMFVQVAASGGETNPPVLRWAKGQIAMTLRQTPAVCQGRFTWARLAQHDLPPASRFAFSFMRYAYDDPFADQVNGVCSRIASL